MADVIAYIGRPPVEVSFGENTGASLAAAAAAEAARDDILNDAGFIAVSTDLTGDNDIGTVAGIASDVTECADNMGAILAAPGAAADALTSANDAAASAAAVVTQAPSYANANGTGDRTAAITVTTTGITGAAGTVNNLIDGVAASNATDGFRLPASTAVAGMSILFDFGAGARVLINEMLAKFQSGNNIGTWKFRAGNLTTSMVDVGSSFTLGSSTSQTLSALSTNVLGYRYYELVGVSGSTSATLNYFQELEFKIAVTAANGLLPLPVGGTAGQILDKASSSNGDGTWREPYPMHTAEMIDEWLFDEMAGTTARGRRAGNSITFDSSFQSTNNSSPEWTRHGIKLELDILTTPSLASVRTVAMLVRVKRNVTTGFIMSFGTTTGGIGVQCQEAPAAWTVSVGRNGVRNLRRHTDGKGAYQLNRGGWYLLIVERDAAYTTTISVGGRSSQTGKDTTYRPTEMEIGWMGAWSDQLTSDEKLNLDTYVRAIAAKKGDILMNWRDTPNYWDQVGIWGQSNALGRALLADLSAADLARRFPNSQIASRYRSTGADYDGLSELVLGQNQHAEFVTTQFGAEFAALAHEDARTTRRRPIAWAKAARGGTRLAASNLGTPVDPSDCWNINEQITTGFAGLFHGCALMNWWDTEAQLLARGIGARPRAMWWLQGESDGASTTYSTPYGTNLQALWDEAKLYCGFEQMVIARTRNVHSSFDATAIAAVRTAQDAMDTNNTDVVTISSDTWSLGADNLHHDAAGMKTGTAALYAATSFA